MQRSSGGSKGRLPWSDKSALRANTAVFARSTGARTTVPSVGCGWQHVKEKMPLYDYQCENCGHTLEVMHGVNDSGPQRCDRCGGSMRKLMSTPAIVFKGSGWAKKDARTSRPSGAAKSATDTESGSGPAASEPKKEAA